MQEKVQSFIGVPLAKDFLGTSGTPILINTLTGICYVLTDAGVVTAIGQFKMAANTIRGNNTGVLANPIDLTVPQLAAMFTLPTKQIFLTGSGTYTTPANVRYIHVRIVGGGSGGGGSGNAATMGNGGAGGNTTFSGLTASGGAAEGFISGGNGGSSYFGGSGRGGTAGGSAGVAAKTNSGSGGGGGSYNNIASQWAGTGGGSGGYCESLITVPAATYSYGVGAAGSAGTAGTSGAAGGAGGAGMIIVFEYYH